MTVTAALTAISFVWTLTAPAPVAQTPAGPTVVETDDYLITTVADGVYALRHKNAVRIGAISGNTTIVIGDRDVLVVDSGSLGSIALADIAMIRKWTNKPVRFVVNTHWHGDHVWGNAEYVKAFPGLTIVAHPETARGMAGYLPTFLKSNPDFPDLIRKAIATKIDFDGAKLTAEREAEIRDDLPNAEIRAREYRTMTTVMPTMTVDGVMTIDLGGRVVEIRYLGRGNTGGDVVVSLPRERIVATGDLVVYPFPFLIGGFPAEWTKTVARIAELGAETIVPGHGAVQTGDAARSYLTLISDFLAVVASAVQQETYARDNGPGNLAAVAAAVTARPDVKAIRARFAAIDPDLGGRFDGGLPQLIESAYRQAWGGHEAAQRRD